MREKKSALSFVKNLRARILKFLLDVDDLTDHFSWYSSSQEGTKEGCQEVSPKEGCPKEGRQEGRTKEEGCCQEGQEMRLFELSI